MSKTVFSDGKTNDFINGLVDRICDTFSDNVAINHNEGRNLPRESEILAILDDLMELVFPGFGERGAHSKETMKFAIGENAANCFGAMRDLIRRALAGSEGKCNTKDEDGKYADAAEDAAKKLLEAIPDIRETLKLDVKAAFDGDPAAKSFDEVVLSYPGLKAITIHRLAHILYCEKVPLIPRMMGEYAHRITGIDIHPGAKLGRGIFIDHGTGVVIGETTVIGDNVKIYQGVTLGAFSFPKDACGMIIKGAKRHPTIEDDVTIYAGATILGDIKIGKGSIIGSNVWLADSTSPGTKVSIAPPALSFVNKAKN